MFFICGPCYRGQVYCSGECRRRSRQEQRRKANRRYQQDPEVRQDHRDRQREYRKQLRDGRVTDQSSTRGCGQGSIAGPLAGTKGETPTAEELHDLGKPTWRERFGGIVCRICGRIGKFVARFIHRE